MTLLQASNHSLVYPFIHPSFFLYSIHPSTILLSIHSSLHSSFCLSINPSICPPYIQPPFILLSTHPLIFLSFYPSIHSLRCIKSLNLAGTVYALAC